jgi:hypothetical protein
MRRDPIAPTSTSLPSGSSRSNNNLFANPQEPGNNKQLLESKPKQLKSKPKKREQQQQDVSKVAIFA